MKQVLLLTALFVSSNAQAQTNSWRLWASGLPSGVFPKMDVAPNHDIYYGLMGIAGNATKGIIYKANTQDSLGSFAAMPTINVPATITNNIQGIICNANSEPIVGIFRSDINDPWLFKYNSNSGAWDNVNVDFPPSLGAFSMAKSPNGNLWVGAKWAYVYKSTDGGANFSRIDETASIQSGYPCYYPTWTGNPSDGAIYAIGVDGNGRVYAGTEGAGVLYSDDDGGTWHPADLFACQSANPMLKDSSSPMKPLSYTGNLGAVGFTADNNLVWNGSSMWSLNWDQELGFADMTAGTTTVAQGFTPYFIGSGLQVTKIVTAANGRMFLHSGSNASVSGTIGIYTSTDGIHWSVMNTGITSAANDGQSQGSLAVDGNKVFMATHDGKVWVYDMDTATTSGLVLSEKTSDLQLYPNPTAQQFSVELAQATELLLLDALGRRLAFWQAQAGQNQFDISHLANGLYWLQDTRTGKWGRLMVQH